MPHFRRSTSKGNTYLQYVKSYRNEKKQPATRVLASLGNITKMGEQEIERLTVSFIRAIGLESKFQKTDFEAGKGYHYGTVLPAMAVWHQLGLGEIITKAVSPRVEIPVSRIALIQTANRFSDPGSKLACYRWYAHSFFSQMKHFISFPEDEEEKLHMYYRALDYLCSAKGEIEKELYFRLQGYGMDSSLILYDLTSTYFEGLEAEIGEQGYSRDMRPDALQIVVGIVMSRDGIPIAHHVFEGNRLDKTTVKEVIKDLKERFGIKEAVFVGDRGMITFENIETLRDYHYEYIMGLPKRNSKLVSYFLDKVFLQPEATIQEFGYEHLSAELKKEYEQGFRFIAGYNRVVAETTRKTRRKNMALFDELMEKTEMEGELEKIKESHYRLKSFLSRKHMTRLYQLKLRKVTASEGEDANPSEEDVYRLEVQKNPKLIEREKRLDGRYFLQTEVGDRVDKETIDSSYRLLQMVERAFRVMKSDFDIQPLYVRQETRIKGHVMICYLALLIEVMIRKKLKELFATQENNETLPTGPSGQSQREEPLTMMTLFEELDTVRFVPLEWVSPRESSHRNPEIGGDNQTAPSASPPDIFRAGRQRKPGKAKDTIYIVTRIENRVKKLLSGLGVRNATHPERLSLIRKLNKIDESQLVFNLGQEYLI